MMWVALSPQNMQMYLTVTGPKTLSPGLRDPRPTSPNVTSAIFYNADAATPFDASPSLGPISVLKV